MINKLIKNLLFLTFALCFQSIHARTMSPAMKDLCASADNIAFTPLKASIREPHSDPLFNAIEMGQDYKTVKRLLNGRHPDSIIRPPGATPLIYAALVGNWPAIKALIDSGANVNFKNKDVITTPLEITFQTSKYAIACKLIEHKAKLPTQKNEKYLFFQNAIASEKEFHNDTAIFIDYLLSNGFNPNNQGNPRMTPLMDAVLLSNMPLIKVLLKHGARLDIAKIDGLTVWDIAREKNNPEVIEILMETQKNKAPAKLNKS